MKRPQLLIQQQLMPTRLELSSYARFAPLSGWHVVLLNQRPTVWQPSRNAVDEALKLQRRQQLLLQEYNVVLAGAWFWQAGLLRRVQAAYESLSSYVERYPKSRHVLLASRSELLKSAQRLGMPMLAVGDSPLRTAQNVDNLQLAIESVAKNKI